MRIATIALTACVVISSLAAPAMGQVNQFGNLLGGGSGLGEPSYSAKLYSVEGAKEGVVEFELTIPDGYKTYDVTEPKGGIGIPATMNFHNTKKKASVKPTEIDFIGPWIPNHDPELVEEAGEPHPVHHGTVVWKSRVKFAEGVDPEKLKLKVYYDGQMCKEGACQPIPKEVELKFAGKIKKEEAEKLPTFDGDGKSKGGLGALKPQGADVEHPLGMIILFALAGGYILNFMPCVLPVIGLKITSFVEQAGESRGRVILLNICYSLGLLAVFMVLATLAAFFSFGWGQQNQSAVFNIAMACVVFAMGLSMIGVWEIPIPGLAMSTSANKLSQKEGPQGAFFLGILTTVLAVPCSGPGLATALTYCQGKPPALIYLVFFFLALGMATPYLLIGAFPAAIKMLPKPGEWMETFKQVMGFVLLGTVVFLLTYIQLHHVVPTIALLFGIWMACWWFGRVPAWESRGKRYTAALAGAGLIAVVGLVCFGWLDDVMQERAEKYALMVADEVKRRLAEGETDNPNKLAWKPYSEEELGKLTSSGKAVMVDFTADWCLTCKTLEKTVLNTKAIKEAVAASGVETLMADWTQENEEIEEMLKRLGSKQIPVLAIFPADNPTRPIVLKGFYSQQTLIDSLQKASGKPVGATAAKEEPKPATNRIVAKTTDAEKS